jgi:type II secretion system protein H
MQTNSIFRAFRSGAAPLKAAGRRAAGFSIIEIMVVLAIGSLMVVVALPSIRNTMSNMHLGSAASALSAAVQSARYRAISNGCPVQLAVSAQSYQVLAQTLTATTPPTCSTTFTAQSYVTGGSTVVPYTASEISLSSVNGTAINSGNPTATLQFNPSGTVTPAGSAVPTSYLLVISQTTGSATKTVNVSGVGYVKVQ